MSRLYDKLLQYSKEDYYPYHMPGHKRHMQGRPLEDLYDIDITEIDGFDNLHHAEGILKEIQERAAALWQTKKTYFLVNGSTCGLLAAIATVSGKDKVFLMARNCHKAAYHGIYVNHAKVHYLYPEADGGASCEQSGGTGWASENAGFAGKITPESVRKSLKTCAEAGEQVAAVLLTSPTYEGIVSDISEISRICHEAGTILIVDEAHGAHLGFSEGYPDSAVHQGADLVIQSVHKTLPAMTQTALLHLCSNRVNVHRLERFLSIYQTSSPSYIMMSSIDLCMDVVEQEGCQRLAERLADADCFRQETSDLKHIRIFYPSDPLKFIISVDGCKMTGKQFYDILLKEYYLQMEMAAGDYVLAMFSMMDAPIGYRRLAKALLEMDHRLEHAGKRTDGESLYRAKNVTQWQTVHPQALLPIHQAYDAPNRSVALQEAVGYVAAEFVSLYPPGIPLLVPGEQIEAEIVALIRTSLKQGLSVIGINSGDKRQNIAVLQA